MPPRKRAREEDAVEEMSPAALTPLHRIRNMWQFAKLMQYITLFGAAVRINPDFDINDLERECLKPQPSEKLANIGLALLKFVSSHKPLNLENFDEYTRRQFIMKAPDRNPYGTEEEPLRFDTFDIPTKISVLQQLAVWTWGNPDRMRALLETAEEDQLAWRMDPFGWDSQLCKYFVLHDRLYRQTDPPPPPPTVTQKAKSKAKKTKGSRASKRRKVTIVDEEEDDEGEVEVEEADIGTEKEDDGFGGATWECVAVTLEEYNAFLDPLRRSRNRDEKDLVADITREVLPELEKHAEALERKAAKERRELDALQKMATAKRSSRIAGRMEKQKEVDEVAEAERKRKEDLAMAHKEEQRRVNMEEARESRMMTREQRLKDREVKRILHEEELSKLSSRDSSEQGEASDGRLSERNRKAALEKTQRVLEELNDSDDWDFDCAICGVHGKNLDDGTHSIACETCNVWQHSACHGIREADAERDDFHFVCASCRRPKVNTFRMKLDSSAPPREEKKKHVNGEFESPMVMPSSEAMAKPLPSTQTHLNGTQEHDHLAPLEAQPSLSRPPRGHFATNGSSPAMLSKHVDALPRPDSSARGLSPQSSSPQHYFLHSMPRQRPHSPTPSMASRLGTASPARTPSLAATQGQTSIRFSPTASPGGHLTHSYSTVLNQPSVAALSPTKQSTSSPPPPRVSLSPTQRQTSARFSAFSNILHEGTPAYAADSKPTATAVSPVKRSSPSASPLQQPHFAPPIQAPGLATPSIRAPPVIMGSASAMSLNGGLTPTLSPSVNAIQGAYETPMKRSFSGGAPPF